MKKNMGSVDRIIRIIIAGIFAYLYFAGIVTGVAGIVLIVAGGILLVTSLVNFCPLYTLLNINTCAVKQPRS